MERIGRKRYMAAELTQISGNSRANTAPASILHERWPTIGQAMNRYEQNVAEAFTRAAYDCVQAGVIRLEDRRRLADQAADVGIREFDAQLLIACAVRQWSLDRRYDPSPSRNAPRLSFEYRSVSKAWWRVGSVIGAALGIDLIFILKWLS